MKNIKQEVLTFIKEVNKEIPKKAIWGMLLLTYVFLVIQSLHYGSMVDKKEKIIYDKEIFIDEYKDIINEYKNVINDYKFKVDRLNFEIKSSKHYSNKMYQKKEEFRKDLIEANNEIIESYNENKVSDIEILENNINDNSMNILLLEEKNLKIEKDLLEIEETNLKIENLKKKYQMLDLLEIQEIRKSLEVDVNIGVEEYEFNPKINELLIIDKTLTMF